MSGDEGGNSDAESSDSDGDHLERVSRVEHALSRVLDQFGRGGTSEAGEENELTSTRDRVRDQSKHPRTLRDLGLTGSALDRH